MLADHIDHVIGVDTHKDSHSAAVVNPTGAVVANRTVPADAFGYKRIHRFALEHARAGACGRSRALAASGRA
jgi:transposase